MSVFVRRKVKIEYLSPNPLEALLGHVQKYPKQAPNFTEVHSLWALWLRFVTINR